MTFKDDFSRGTRFERATLLWLAQGFGTGWAPGFPGTLGSMVGIGWFVLLISSGNLAVYLIGSGFGLLFSVFVCHVAEQILQQKDPGSVVMDEITALPVCFVGAMIWKASKATSPSVAIDLARVDTWGWIVIGFVAFRAFDIAKPWPIRRSQYLGGGLGITIDDLLAAVYVNLITLPIGIWWHREIP